MFFMVLVLLLVNYIITLHWTTAKWVCCSVVFNSPEAKLVIINLCLNFSSAKNTFLAQNRSWPEDVRESVLGTAGSADVGPGH